VADSGGDGRWLRWRCPARGRTTRPDRGCRKIGEIRGGSIGWEAERERVGVLGLFLFVFFLVWFIWVN